MNLLAGLAVFGLLALPQVSQRAPEPRTEFAYRSQVGVVTEWRTSMSSDIRFLDAETDAVVEEMTMTGVLDSDLIGAKPGAEGERLELLHLRRMQVTITSGDEEPKTMIMSRDSMQDGDEIVRASEVEAIDEWLEKMFGGPNMSFRLTQRGVEAQMSPYGKAEEDAEIAEMGLGDEFLLLHPVLPEGPVAVGAKWSGRREISSEYTFEKPIHADIDYEFVDLADGIATIRAKARVEVEGPLTGQSDEGETVLEDLVFAQESTIRFRVAEGALESAETSFTFDARILPDEESAEAAVMKSSSRVAIERRPPADKSESAK